MTESQSGDEFPHRKRAEERDRDALKRGSLETHRDVSDFVHYVTRHKRDYDGHSAEFYWPELGLDFDVVEHLLRAASVQRANKGKRIYVALGSELWLAFNGSVSKRAVLT